MRVMSHAYVYWESCICVLEVMHMCVRSHVCVLGVMYMCVGAHVYVC
jgi:hypothetical protein